MKSNDLLLRNISYMVAEQIINKCVVERNGDVPKDIVEKTPFDKKSIALLPKNMGREQALAEPEKFNEYLCATLKKRLEWYVLEGYAWEDETCFYFFTQEEVDELIDSINS